MVRKTHEVTVFLAAIFVIAGQGRMRLVAEPPDAGLAQSKSQSNVGHGQGCIGPVDIGLFARVVSSDPNRRDGARSERLQEFPAEDVFLTTELIAGADGAYTVPTFADGQGCIGLEWAERRVLTEVSLQFSDPTRTPLPEGVEVQYWSSGGREDSWGTIGQTPWQGQWEKLPGRIEKRDGRWMVAINKADVPEFRKDVGVLKLRWLFPPTAGPIKIRKLSAFGASSWATGEFRVEIAPDAAAKPVTIRTYNGLFLDADNSGVSCRQTWDPRTPLQIRLRYSVPRRSKADRTLLRFELPAGAFSIAVEDLLDSDGVYVKDYGLFAVRNDAEITLAEYREKIAERKRILERVRELPDQTLDRAMKSLWRPAQNHGPTMLSLACDNHKFIVQRNGEIQYGHLTVAPHFASTSMDLVRMDWGQIGVDTTVRPPHRKGLPLRLGDKTYKKGIGLHANAELAVQLDGRYETFAARVGVFPSGAPGGSVVFQVIVDGQKKFDSGVMRQKDPSKPIKIAVAGANRLVLRLTHAGDGIVNDAGNWADARLTPTDSNGSSGEVYLSDLYAAGERTDARRTRQLEGAWLPIVVNTTNDGKVTIRQRTFVAPFDWQSGRAARFGKMKSLGVVEFAIQNSTTHLAQADFGIRFPAGADNGGVPRLQRVQDRVLVISNQTLLACVDTGDAAPLGLSVHQGALKLAGDLPARTTRHCVVYIPAWEMKPDEQGVLPGECDLRSEVEAYWRDALAPAMHVEIPDALVEKVVCATQVHCMLAARNQAEGKLIEPWIASDRYGPLDTEAQAVVLGMDLWGHHEFARRSTNMFFGSYNQDGMLAKGYTLMGLGQHLWTLGEHYALTRDKDWLQRVVPKLLLACRWIKRQTEKTKKLDPRGGKVPEYGLMPPGVLADWNRYAYYMYANAHFCAGVKAVSRILADIGDPAADELAKFADEYRNNILRAYRWNQARMPVLPLRDGSWVPPTVSSMYTYGLTRDFFGGVSAIGHDVEVGGSHLIPLGLIDPTSRQADWIINYMEDRWFYIDGLFGAYPAVESEKDWFNYGGFAKLQPHYARTSDIHALRDDVKPFVRTYFNTFPVLLNKENLSYWEHFNHVGGWNKTHESAWFLEMTRTMLVMERGNELWLAPFVTNNWLKDGMIVAVRNAPTHFGRVNYKITSSVSRGHIDVHIDPPTRNRPDRIVIRIRHPDGKPIRRVRLEGGGHPSFDNGSETVSFTPANEPISLRIEY